MSAWTLARYTLITPEELKEIREGDKIIVKGDKGTVPVIVTGFEEKDCQKPMRIHVEVRWYCARRYDKYSFTFNIPEKYGRTRFYREHQLWALVRWIMWYMDIK